MQKPMIENKEVDENKTAPAKPGKRRLIIITLIVLLAAGLSYGALKYTSLLNSDTENDLPEMSALRHSKVKSVIPLDPFLVNLADPYEARFVKTTFHLGLAETSKQNNPATMAAIRDTIISLLSSKTADQILTVEGKESLREAIRSKVNELAPALQVVEVYIVDFVIQL